MPYGGNQMHKHLIVAASVLILATIGEPAWAAWGCATGARSGGWGVGWGQRTKAEAMAVALAACNKEGRKGCYITSCGPNVDTEAEADALWPHLAPTSHSIGCGSPGQPKC